MLFFGSLGFDFEGKLSDDAVIQTIVSEDINAMRWIPPCHVSKVCGTVPSGTGIART